MTARTSPDSPVSHPAVAEANHAPAGAPRKLNVPPGSWLTLAIDRKFPDRVVGDPVQPFAPTHPENNGWVWPEKVRAGDLVVVVGEAGTGKSTVMADWIARVTTGTPFPGCDQDHALPPADVLVFNAREDFPRKVIPGIEAAGGDVDRVYRASRGLLKTSPQQEMLPARCFWGNTGGVKVHLYDDGMLHSLHSFLHHRPSIRMVVIDQANTHLRCASERQFDVVIQELTRIAQECEVAVVITMQPDAFRKAEGVAKYLQSRSLKENAHSVWRMALPTDPELPGRVLEILKTSHGVADHGQQAWHLIQGDDQRLAWNTAQGTELAPGKDLVRYRNLVRVREFLDQILLVLGGMAGWEVLAERAANQGIHPGLLREGVVYWNVPSLFEPHAGDLREVIGYAEQIAARREELHAEQVALREALRTGQSTVSLDPATGTDRPPMEMPEKTSVEPLPSPPSTIPVSGPATGSASFIKPEVVTWGEGRDDAAWEGGTGLRVGVKPPATVEKKVAQAG